MDTDIVLSRNTITQDAQAYYCAFFCKVYVCTKYIDMVAVYM